MRTAATAMGGVALLLTLSACESWYHDAPAAPSTSASATSQYPDVKPLMDTAIAKVAEVKTAKFTVAASMGSKSTSVVGEGEFTESNAKISVITETEEGKVEQLLVDKTIYGRELIEGGEPEAKPWVKVDVTNNAKDIGESIHAIESANPASALKVVQRAGKITKVEKEPEATRYSIDVEVLKAGSFGGLTPAQLEGTPPGTVMPVELLITGDGLLSQVTMHLGKMLESAAKQQGRKAPTSIADAKYVAEYSDWGKPVDVAVPPADQIRN